MSKTPLFLMPFKAPNPSGVPVDPFKLSLMFPSTVEQDAQAHWLFGADNPTMADLVSGQLATCSAGAPTQATGYLTPPTGGVDYINSGIADAASQTLCAVYQQQTDAQRVIMGAWHQGGGVGCVLYFSLTGTHVAFTDDGGSHTPTPPSSGNVWLFVAKISTPAVGETIVWGNISSMLSYAYSSPKTLDATKNVGWAGSFEGTFATGASTKLAEGIVFNKVLTPFELALVYQRSKTRLAARGITVY